MARDLMGQEFGKWTVQGESITTEQGERKWLCRCSCGTERYVLERSLLSGGSLSCGCLRKENATKAVSPDLTAQVFGELTALHRIPPKQGDKRTWWLCRSSFEFEEERLAAAFRNLPIKRQQILEMLFIEQMKPEEIARELNCTVQHVYNRRSSALKALRLALKEEGNGNDQ